MYGPVPVLFPFPLPEEIILSRNIRLSYFFFYLFNVMSVFFGDGIPGSSRIVISGHRYLLLLNPTLPPGGFCFLGKMSAMRISLNHDTSPYTLYCWLSGYEIHDIEILDNAFPVLSRQQRRLPATVHIQSYIPFQCLVTAQDAGLQKAFYVGPLQPFQCLAGMGLFRFRNWRAGPCRQRSRLWHGADRDVPHNR